MEIIKNAFRKTCWKQNFVFWPLKEYKALSDFDPHKTVVRGYKTVITFYNCGTTAIINISVKIFVSLSTNIYSFVTQKIVKQV